jgi:hypothetical protein
VPCGAKLWAVKLWEKNPLAFAAGVRVAALPFKNRGTVAHERTAAMRVITTPKEAWEFYSRYNAAIAAHNAKTKELDRKDER